jgi:two-component system sensor histidine kinase YesM
LSFLFLPFHRQADSQPCLTHGEVEQGNLQTQAVKSRIWEFAQLEHSFNIMVQQIAGLLELTP